MPDVLGTTTPIVLLIDLGHAAVHRGLSARSTLPALGSFVISFCIPALLVATAASVIQRHPRRRPAPAPRHR